VRSLPVLPDRPRCTVSVGVASAPARMTGLEQLLSQADVALYRAKAMGRNRVVA